jgi:hypothetical protein
MNIRKHLSTALVLGTLALGLTSVKANAQPVLKGTFELPAAAYFGDKLLQPGQYTIWTSTEVRDIANVPVIHLSGEGVNASYLAIAKPAAESGRNYLDIATIDGTYVIRAFDAGSIGESFAFGVTKSVRSKALRASLEPAMAVPVSSVAGL